MKLRNKETGQVFETIQPVLGGEGMSIAELNEKWEDAPEEPKEYYIINLWGEVCVEGGKYQRPGLSELGLTFETKEEAEKAVEKLKALKRLKDKGFKFYGDIRYECLCGNGFNILLKAEMPPEAYTDEEVSEDLTLLFRSEE